MKNKKDIITLVASGLILVGCLIFIIVFFFPSVGSQPSVPATVSTTEAETKITADGVTGKDSQDLINKVNNLTKYGETNLEGIGRVNPFATLN